jgi:hypothetical protein
VAESETIADGTKSMTNLHVLMNWQNRGGVEASVPRLNQAVMARLRI